LTVAGRMSFGTTGGSRQSSADNNQPLSGHNYDASGILSVWPYANSWVGTLGLLSTLDYPAYLQAIVDGETSNVGYDSAKAVTPPFLIERPRVLFFQVSTRLVRTMSFVFVLR